MKVLSVFSGIGLHDLGLVWAGMEIAGQIEYDPYCNEILESRFPGVARWTDVRAVEVGDIEKRIGRPDLITGGFPCTDISVAGKGAGLEGEHSGLWSELYRLIAGLTPNWILVENVPALRGRGADRVLSELGAAGYTCWPCVVGAGHFAAPHRRQRVWIVGYANSGWKSQSKGSKPDQRRRVEHTGQGVGQADSSRNGRGTGPGIARDESSEGSGRDQSPGSSGVGLANPECRAIDQRSEPAEVGGRARDSEQAGVGSSDFERMEIPNGQRFGELNASCFPDSTKIRGWPAPPGAQRQWEAPRIVASNRVVKSSVGSAVDGRSRRLAGAERRAALKALGNANPPQVVEALGRAILKLNGEME